MSENLFGLTVAADAAFAFAGSPFGKQPVVIEQPPFLTNETEKGRGAICPRP